MPDDSAMLAYLHAKPGRQRVESLLLDERCLLLTIDLAEFLSYLTDWGVPSAEANARMAGLGLELVSFDHSLVRQAAQMRPYSMHLELSHAVGGSRALAKARTVPAVTADRPRWRPGRHRTYTFASANLRPEPLTPNASLQRGKGE